MRPRACFILAGRSGLQPGNIGRERAVFSCVWQWLMLLLADADTDFHLTAYPGRRFRGCPCLVCEGLHDHTGG